MLMLAADENFNNNIVRGVLRRRPDLDFICIQDVGLSGADDPESSPSGKVKFSIYHCIAMKGNLK